MGICNGEFNQEFKTKKNIFSSINILKGSNKHTHKISNKDNKEITHTKSDESNLHTNPSFTLPKTAPTTNLTPSQLQISTRVVTGSVWDSYKSCNRILGTGMCGSVLLGERSGRNYAIKNYKKKKFDPVWYYNEANIYLVVDHPHIARLMEIYEDEHYFSLVMEYCSGGELFDRLAVNNFYSESDARIVTIQMLSAIQYLHSHSIVHRDLKLENWVYTTSNVYSLKLIDFGFSRIWNKHNPKMRSMCGTIAYISPEVMLGNYTNACDLWSLGVIVYMLLIGLAPFYGPRQKIVQDILDGNFSKDRPQWSHCSELAHDFISNLLIVDPQKRMTAAQALNHAWICFIPSEPIEIDQVVVSSMQKFAKSTKFKRAALLVMAMWLNYDEIEGMREIFLAFDKTQNGTILLSEFAYALKEGADLTLHEIQDIFNSMDNSGNEEIYYTEFLAAMLDLRLKFCDDIVRSAFEKFDVDHSGYVSLENLRQIFGREYMDTSIEDWIKEYDITGNGMLDYEEFLLAVTGDDNSQSTDEFERFSQIVTYRDRQSGRHTLKHNILPSQLRKNLRIKNFVTEEESKQQLLTLIQ